MKPRKGKTYSYGKKRYEIVEEDGGFRVYRIYPSGRFEVLPFREELFETDTAALAIVAVDAANEIEDIK